MEKLTKSEEEVLIMLWEKGPSTVSDLIKEMPEPKPAHSTISSFVRILEKKGYVDHKAYSRIFVYFPIVAKKDYTTQRVGHLVSQYFKGSVNNLVSFLAKENNMSLADMQSILDKIKNDEE